MNEKIFENIVEQIRNERKYQTDSGGDSLDDKHTINDWVVFINRYTARAAPRRYDDDAHELAFHANLIKAGAIIFATLEAQERNLTMPPRHYDGGNDG